MDSSSAPPPDPPVSIALAPRAWLSREAGECAFPVDGDGWTVRACCNLCGPATYCRTHRNLMRGPAAPSVEQVERALHRFIG